MDPLWTSFDPQIHELWARQGTRDSTSANRGGVGRVRDLAVRELSIIGYIYGQIIINVRLVIINAGIHAVCPRLRTPVPHRA